MHVKVRLTGKTDEVERVVDLLRDALSIESESRDYRDRNGDGVRRYLDVSLAEAATDPQHNDER